MSKPTSNRTKIETAPTDLFDLNQVLLAERSVVASPSLAIGFVRERFGETISNFRDCLPKNDLTRPTHINLPILLALQLAHKYKTGFQPSVLPTDTIFPSETGLITSTPRQLPCEIQGNKILVIVDQELFDNINQHGSIDTNFFASPRRYMQDFPFTDHIEIVGDEVIKSRNQITVAEDNYFAVVDGRMKIGERFHFEGATAISHRVRNQYGQKMAVFSYDNPQDLAMYEQIKYLTELRTTFMKDGIQISTHTANSGQSADTNIVDKLAATIQPEQNWKSTEKSDLFNLMHSAKNMVSSTGFLDMSPTAGYLNMHSFEQIKETLLHPGAKLMTIFSGDELLAYAVYFTDSDQLPPDAQRVKHAACLNNPDLKDDKFGFTYNLQVTGKGQILQRLLSLNLYDMMVKQIIEDCREAGNTKCAADVLAFPFSNNAAIGAQRHYGSRPTGAQVIRAVDIRDLRYERMFPKHDDLGTQRVIEVFNVMLKDLAS